MMKSYTVPSVERAVSVLEANGFRKDQINGLGHVISNFSQTRRNTFVVDIATELITITGDNYRGITAARKILKGLFPELSDYRVEHMMRLRWLHPELRSKMDEFEGHGLGIQLPMDTAIVLARAPFTNQKELYLEYKQNKLLHGAAGADIHLKQRVTLFRRSRLHNEIDEKIEEESELPITFDRPAESDLLRIGQLLAALTNPLVDFVQKDRITQNILLLLKEMSAEDRHRTINYFTIAVSNLQPVIAAIRQSQQVMQ